MVECEILLEGPSLYTKTKCNALHTFPNYCCDALAQLPFVVVEVPIQVWFPEGGPHKGMSLRMFQNLRGIHNPRYRNLHVQK